MSERGNWLPSQGWSVTMLTSPSGGRYIKPRNLGLGSAKKSTPVISPLQVFPKTRYGGGLTYTNITL